MTPDYTSYVSFTPNDGSILFKLEKNKLSFSANNYAKPSTDYKIKIDKGLHDFYGRTLQDSVVIQFTTPSFILEKVETGNITITRDTLLAKQDYDTLSTQNFNYQLFFSHPLDLLTLEKNIISTPFISGNIFVNIQDIKFSSNNVLIPDTLYNIQINSSIKELHGIELDTNYTITFRTEKFKIDRLYKADSSSVHLFTISTNSILNIPILSSTIEVFPTYYQSGLYELTSDSTGINFKPDSTIIRGNKISVVVNTNFMDIYGNKIAKNDTLIFYRDNMFSIKNLEVGTLEAENLFKFRTNYLLDSLEIPNGVNIEPIRYEFGSFTLRNDTTETYYEYSFIPDSSIQFGDEINIVLDSNLIDIYGNRLEDEKNLSFIVSTQSWR